MNDPKIILLTGATGLIGHELARNFVKAGHSVIATSRGRLALDPLIAETRGFPGKLVPIELDLLTADIDALAQDLLRRDFLPHHLVNNARDIENLYTAGRNRGTRAQWSSEFDLGVVVPAELTLALAEMPNSRLDSVINIGSMYGVVAVNPNLYSNPSDRAPLHYGVVKAALVHLTRELAVRLAPRVRVNAVSFGGIEGRTNEAFKSRYRALSPTGRMLRLDEVFAPIEFLLSHKASAITGHNLVADGGWTLW